MKMRLGIALLLLCIGAAVFASETEHLLNKEDLPLDEQLSFTTTRVIGYISDDKPASTGTGFILLEFFPENQSRQFLVTCAHVVEGMSKIVVVFNRSEAAKPKVGMPVQIEIKQVQDVVFYHPDPTVDVAILNLTPYLVAKQQEGVDAYYRSVGFQNTQRAKADRELSSLQSVLFIGYPYGLIDEKNLLPLARRGISATSPKRDFKGLPLFLIDASVFPGSSGSPVFAYDDGVYRSKDGTSIGTQSLFVGMISEAYIRTAAVK